MYRQIKPDIEHACASKYVSVRSNPRCEISGKRISLLNNKYWMWNSNT